MAEITVPAWFSSSVYFQNKLTSLGQGWTRDALNAAFTSAGYSLDAAGMYRHFLDFGNSEGVSPNSLFNTQQYLENKAADFFGVSNPTNSQIALMASAITAAGMTVWEHYCQYGWREGINPSDAFDANQYFTDKLGQLGGGWTTTSVMQAFANAQLNPVTHYYSYGIQEGLNAKPVSTSEPSVPIPSVKYSVLHLRMMDISGYSDGSSLLDNPFDQLTFTYVKPNNVKLTCEIKLRDEDVNLYKGENARYYLLVQAFEHALADAGLDSLISVRLGKTYIQIDPLSGTQLTGNQIIFTANAGYFDSVIGFSSSGPMPPFSNMTYETWVDTVFSDSNNVYGSSFIENEKNFAMFSDDDAAAFAFDNTSELDDDTIATVEAIDITGVPQEYGEYVDTIA